MKTAKLGAIRTRSNNSADLVCAFAKKLLWLDNEGAFRFLINESLSYFKYPCSTGDTSSLIERLSNSLNTFAPKYAHFGINPNDDNLYGYWLDGTIEKEFDGLLIYELSEIPERYTGEVIHMTTPTNLTLYFCTDRALTIVWSI